MESEVLVSDLVKRYPKSETNAVDGLGFEVLFGEIFGLLGPNGAGKSTTIGVLTTRVKPTSGRAEIAGVDVTEDPVRVKRLLAVVPQQVNLDRSLTPRQNLVFHATYHGYSGQDAKRRAAELLAEFGLEEQADTKVDWYSGGMAQRLMVARSMMHEPRVLFLDEPTTGLDPQSRLFLWERVRALRERGTTVVLTTHDMDEAAEMSDRVGIVDHGKLLALDTPAALTKGLSGKAVLELEVELAESDTSEGLLAALGEIPGVENVEEVAAGPILPPGMPSGIPPGQFPQPPAGGGSGPVTLRLYVERAPASLLGAVASVLTTRSAQMHGVQVSEPSLEDVFIELTGRSLR
ncbi:MAG TPA: ABC transporter ATP-binding protein [Acidimicrobiia bacterium]|nr:ABC transporter ATP-binding protein [Acidimicrobiia bacterium]